MNNLKQIRQSVGITGRAMAQLMGVSVTTISTWENNTEAIPFQIAAYKHVGIEKLISEQQYVAKLKRLDSTKTFGLAIETIIMEGE
jgi:transcriptional regulator with XRE-family HTH domain